MRPVMLKAHSDTTMLQLIACGEREYVEKQRYNRCISEGSLLQGGRFGKVVKGDAQNIRSQSL